MTLVDLVKQLREGVEKRYSRESLETMLLWAADEIERLRSGPREAVARWMMFHGYPTGHGDTIEDLLAELVAECKTLRAQKH